LPRHLGGAVPDISYGRTYQELCQAVPKARRGKISDACCESWQSAGMVWHGEFWTASLPEYQTGRRVDSQGRYRNAAGVSTLSEVLEPTAQGKYSLSARACEGIIRRAEKRGKSLPKILMKALEWVISQDSSTTSGPNGGGTAITSASPSTQSTATPSRSLRTNATRSDWRVFDGSMVGALHTGSGKNDHFVMTQFGEVAGTLMARADSSPNVDGGQNVVCMESAQTSAVIEVDQSPTLNASHEQPIICCVDDNGKTAIEEDMCGSLKVGGGSAVNSNGEMVVGALCARDFKGVGNEYVSEGKVICQKHTC